MRSEVETRAALVGAIRQSFNLPPNDPTLQTSLADTLKAADVPDVCIENAEATVPAQPLTPDQQQEVKEKRATTEADVFNALDKYAKALATISKKSDVDDYKAAASDVSSSVGTLASTVGSAFGPVGAAAGPVAKAVVTLGLRLNLVRLEGNRYKALRSAVVAACIPVHNLSLAEGIILRDKWSHALIDNRNVILHLSRVKQTSAVKAAMLQAAANIRNAPDDPGKTADKIATAHDALVKDVVAGKVPSDELLSTLSDLLTDATALKDALSKKPSSSIGS